MRLGRLILGPKRYIFDTLEDYYAGEYCIADSTPRLGKRWAIVPKEEAEHFFGWFIDHEVETTVESINVGENVADDLVYDVAYIKWLRGLK